MTTDWESHTGHNSNRTVKGDATGVNNKIASFRKQSSLLVKLKEVLSKNKALEDLIRSLQSTIVSLEATNKSSYGAAVPNKDTVSQQHCRNGHPIPPL